MTKFVTLQAILRKLVEAARNKPETTGKLVTFILKNEKKIKPLVKASAGAATDIIAATEVLKKVNDVTGDNMNKVDKFVFDNAAKAISILQDATSITNLLTGGKTKSGAGKFFRQAEKFINPGQIILEQMKGKINMANKLRNKLFGPNDLSWYGHYPELNQAMIGPNFYNIVGSNLHAKNKSVPLGMSINLLLTIPTKVGNVSWDNNTGNYNGFETNVWDSSINRIYASIRRANSGAINYAPKDLNLFIINFRSVLAEYVMLGRVYGTIIKYKLMNRAVPQLFYQMMGIKNNQASYENNAANLYNKLTQWRVRLNSVCPIYLDLFKRTEWLFSGFWKDDDSSKAQYFAFSSNRFPKYDYALGSTGNDSQGIANWAMKDGLDITFADVCKNMENDINNLANHPTNVIIAGDMLKAFADAGMKQYQLPAYPENYEAPEAYDEEALTIIQNSSTVPWDYKTGTARLWMYNGAVFTDLKHDMTSSNIDPFYNKEEAGKYINAYKGVRSVINDNKLTLALTRLTTPYSNASFGVNHVGYSKVIGTEVALNRNFFYSQDGQVKSIEYFDYKKYDTTEDPSEYFLLSFLWAGVDWAPMLKPAVRMNVSESSAILYPDPLFDWELYSYVTTEQLETYNDIVTMNLLYVPEVYKPNKVELVVHTTNNTGTQDNSKHRSNKKRKSDSSK